MLRSSGVRLSAFGFLLLAPIFLSRAASPPWAKPSSEWTSSDVQIILSNSPWARSSSADFDVPPENADVLQPQELPGPSQAGMAGKGATDGRWDGGVGRVPRGGTVVLPITVRWDSAAPVREALAREDKSLGPEPNAPENNNTYLITVVGLLPRKSHPSDPDDMEARNQREETLEALMQNSRLYCKDRSPIGPTNVKIDDATGIVYLYFSKSDPIALSDKEVSFRTSYGQMRVAQKFRLKDMVWNGKLEL